MASRSHGTTPIEHNPPVEGSDRTLRSSYHMLDLSGIIQECTLKTLLDSNYAVIYNQSEKSKAFTNRAIHSLIYYLLINRRSAMACCKFNKKYEINAFILNSFNHIF
jgi:hypothetical protein